MRTVAVYTGSFNPFHKGHLDILNKAKRMFDEVVIAVGHNPDKYMLSEVHQRIETIEAQLPDQKVLYYNGFTTDLLDSLEVNDVISGFGDTVTVVEFVNIDEQLFSLMLFSLIEVFTKTPEIVMIFLPVASKITVGFVSPPSVV